MRDAWATEVTQTIRSIANLIEAEPMCLTGFFGKNDIGEPSEVSSILTQEFTIRLEHTIMAPEKPA